MSLILHRAKLFLFLLFAAVAAVPRGDTAGARALPSYGVDLSQTTVSGLSSGAFMAGQFAVAFSSIVSGAGIVAGGPYYCAGEPGVYPFISYLNNAMTECMNPGEAAVEPPDAQLLWDHTEEFSRAGVIDDAANLRRQAIYLFSGTRDETVTTDVVDQTYRYYQLADAQKIRYVDNVPAGHAMITDDSANHACPVTAPPFINNCGIREAQEILDFLYTGMKPPAARLSGTTLEFDQGAFTQVGSSMSERGYAYVPASCETQTCRVHIAFHGCLQGARAIGDQFYGHAGYNEVADTNELIVLYPQVEPSYLYPYNPKGCWDFWGYSTFNPFAPAFYTKAGPQMAAVRAMLDRLAQRRSSSH